MGKNNKARRAAKAKQRSRQASPRATPKRSASDDALEYGEVWNLLFDAVKSTLTIGPWAARPQITQVQRHGRPHMVKVGDAVLLKVLTELWRCGWQPAEVARIVRRRSNARMEWYVVAAIAADLARRGGQSIDPRWQAQLDLLGVEALDPEVTDSVTGWIESELGLDRTVELIVEILTMIAYLPNVEVLIPPPGSAATPKSTSTEVDDANQAILDRVRNLLAKAESTEFDAEAEAFTAKAHEMMAKHAIDSALLAPQAALDEEPTSIRVPIDDPYADSKSLLLQVVAQTNRCRAVYSADLGMSTVIGFAVDLAVVEMLHASLLVQAQAAIAAAARDAPPRSRQRSSSYRSAFLAAYVRRIGQRLDDISNHINSETDQSASALPVLRTRVEHVEDRFQQMFPSTTAGTIRDGFDAAGHASGRLAADLAKLNLADLADDPVGSDGGVNREARSLPPVG